MTKADVAPLSGPAVVFFAFQEVHFSLDEVSGKVLEKTLRH